MLHGVYSTWGPFREYFFKNGIAVYVYIKALNPEFGCFYFDKLVGNQFDIWGKEVWAEKKNKELSIEQKRTLRDFLVNKKEGKTDDYHLLYGKKQNKVDNALMSLLNASDKKKYVLYMHSLWDQDLENVASNCFEGIIEWTFQTIDYFINKQDYHLILKPHPVEYCSWDTRESGILELISNKYSQLPDNIYLIEKDAHLTSFDNHIKGCGLEIV